MLKSELDMTNFEKIKSIIPSLSAEECAVMMDNSPFVFHCAFCESDQNGDGRCDGECEAHLLNWLNSPVSEE